MKRQNNGDNRYITWIDHKKAVVGRFNPDDEFSHMIFRSGIESRLRYKGEETDKSRVANHTINRQPQLQHKFNQELSEFCSRVAGLMDRIGTILVLGPADTKHIFKNELEKKFGMNRFAIVLRSADKMTVASLKEAGKKFYNIPAAARKRKKRLQGLVPGNKTL